MIYSFQGTLVVELFINKSSCNKFIHKSMVNKKMSKTIYTEMLYPPSSLFQNSSIPFAWITPFESISITGPSSGTMPITLFWRTSTGKVHYLAFMILCCSSHETGNLSLNIDRLCVFADEPEEREKIFNLVLDQCQGLARLIHAVRLEIELYVEVKGPICFPSGSSYLDSCNSLDLVHLCVKNGFHKREERYCLSYDLTETQSVPKNRVRPITDKPKDIEEFSRLCRHGRRLIRHNRLFAPRTLTGRNVTFLSDPRLTLVGEKGLNQSSIGYLNWSPNVYHCLSAMGSKVLYQSLEEIVRESKLIETCKIFNIVVDDRSVGAHPEFCLDALEQFRAFGFSSCQIGEVAENESEFLRFLQDEKFKRTHVMWILEKDV